MLRVTMRVIKAGVFPYRADEHGPETAEQYKGKDVIRELIRAESFTQEALKSLEGKPVIISGHEWRDIDNTLTDGLTVGNIAGTPHVDGEAIIADAIILNPKVIEAIGTRDLVEVSAGYEAGLEKADSPDYDAVQGEPRFNHVLLLPEGKGRCGHDVRIINALPEGAQKENTRMKVKVKNAKGVERVYEFTNEADKDTAERMAADATQDATEKGTAEVETKNHELETARAELETIKAKMKELQDLVAKFASEEYQEAAAMERAQYKDSEEAVMNAEVPEGERDGLKEKLGNCKSLVERRNVLTVHVMNSKGVKLEGKSDDAIAVAFQTLVSFANSGTVDAGKAQPPKAKVGNEKPALHPIFMRVK